MLTLPLTSVLLASLLMGADAIPVMPLVIVAVVVAYVASARIIPATGPEEGEPAPAQPGAAVQADRAA
jgi:hypothetical protein